MQHFFLSLMVVSLPTLFFYVTGVVSLLNFCAFDILLLPFFPKKVSWVSLSESVNAALLGFFYKISVDPSVVMGILLQSLLTEKAQLL
jgi:hypothetical protein